MTSEPEVVSQNHPELVSFRVVFDINKVWLFLHIHWHGHVITYRLINTNLFYAFVEDKPINKITLVLFDYEMFKTWIMLISICSYSMMKSCEMLCFNNIFSAMFTERTQH